jgi:hypothetical protein
MLSDSEQARFRFINALKLDISKLSVFESEFPEYYDSIWTQNIIRDIKKASE